MSAEREAETAALSPAAPPVSKPVVITVFTAIASQAALITALLYFFGRVHVSAVYGYFGIDANSLGFSTSDYVVGSLNATLPPVVLCALAILAVLALVKRLDRVVSLIRQRGRIKRMTTIAIGVVIVMCAIVVLNGISRLPTAAYSRGYPLPIAVMGMAVAVGVGRRILAPAGGNAQPTDPLWSMMVAAFALAGVLWVTDLYVGASGHREGEDKANTLRSSTSSDLVLYSANRLAIAGPGVQSDSIIGADNRYHVQYSGLRLLIRTAQEYVIVPAYWQKGRDHVIVLPVGDSIRFDLVPH
ncbi:hypothetical protein FHT40_006153 [Mycolicibacterium sp. BK556]|uniref:hypothetical protein n=1 Tax=Mycobacteriaceae TaxID=1762 RepID=UPI0010495C3B|nr:MULTISPECIES: hypothetical protein [Mycobacteriaceae]MBB3606462.1 hypothetical protein [Mycolicibacterium sp. BK556]MBB3636292.1 hypothetical protein [Mycolicibacterium sp. BK607]TDO06434.1 hypothetical protein EV580_6521 [Mycobacterium sp. BK086]